MTILTQAEAALLINNEGHADIPEGVTEIGDRAFLSTELKSVTIPSTVTTIGVDGFARTKLESLVIPDTVTHIRVIQLRVIQILKI